MNNCIFCKIAAGEIQGLRVCEDAETLAFMGLFQHASSQLSVQSCLP